MADLFHPADVSAAASRSWNGVAPAQSAQSRVKAETSPTSFGIKRESSVGIKPADPVHFSIKKEPDGEHLPFSSDFANEPLNTLAASDNQKPKTFQLQSLLKDAGPQMLETSVEVCSKLLFNPLRSLGH